MSGLLTDLFANVTTASTTTMAGTSSTTTVYVLGSSQQNKRNSTDIFFLLPFFSFLPPFLPPVPPSKRTVRQVSSLQAWSLNAVTCACAAPCAMLILIFAAETLFLLFSPLLRPLPLPRKQVRRTVRHRPRRLQRLVVARRSVRSVHGSRLVCLRCSAWVWYVSPASPATPASTPSTPSTPLRA